jgi:RNA polymerase sigma-70 factor (ECF subfamily)
LLLFALGDLNYESISRATNVPFGTVRSRLHRARRCISVELGVVKQATGAETP